MPIDMPMTMLLLLHAFSADDNDEGYSAKDNDDDASRGKDNLTAFPSLTLLDCMQ